MLVTAKLVALVAATITLTVLSSCGAQEIFKPDLEVFANYEDMRRYIASRSQRSMRFIDNPTHDTYITAYNEHHELAPRERQRRATNAQQARKLPSEPQLVKFEITDAIEPSAEMKEMIRQHRSREEKSSPASSTTRTKSKVSTITAATPTEAVIGKTKSKSTTTAPARSTRATRAKITRSKRPKRATANVTPNQRPLDFQVKLIPFDISEAREPDEQTKALIRRMRNLELQKLRDSTATSTATPAAIRVYRNAPTQILTQPPSAPVPTFNPAKYYRPKTGKFFMKRKGKRVKRSAPQMIRFELEDARQPDAATLEQLHLARQSNAFARAQKNQDDDVATVINKREARMDNRVSAQPVKEEVDEDETDLNGGESKRLFMYKEAPIVKVKKSIGSLPAEVQKIITHLMKDHGAGSGGANGGKAYVKYIPAHSVDYRQLKSLYGSKLALPATYSVGGGGGGKLSPASYMKYVQPQQKAEQLQVQIHPVPVVEKIRYIYTPVAAAPARHAYVNGAEDHAAAQAAAAHAVQAVYAGHNVHAVAEAQAAQAAHAAEAYDAQSGGDDAGGQEGGRMEHPIVVPEGGGAGGSEAHKAVPVEIHHTYAADGSHALEEEVPVAVAIKGVHFKPSKLDPLLNENKLSETAAVEAGAHGGFEGYSGEQQAAAEYASDGYSQAGYQPVEQYKYETLPAAQLEKEAEAPLIKIEYHGPADAAKQNFKELPEFKELSTLVGKSTEDQIHGLTYLLAKEMQNKLKLQRKKLQAAEGLGAHSNTAPILFPLGAQQVAAQKQQQVQGHGGAIQGRLIGMAKSKEYIPIVEQAPASEQKAAADSSDSGGGYAGHGSVQHISIPAAKQYVSVKVEPKAPLAKSYIEYGLSPNYYGMKAGGGGGGGGQKTKLLVEQVIHHPTMKYNGGDGARHAKAIAAEADSHGGGSSSEQSLSYGDELQYASKYAFGYRIRDFSTGNDFGHKQNRDLDGVTRGQYHILLPDGRIQNVIYHADDTGFHADVSFETGH